MAEERYRAVIFGTVLILASLLSGCTGPPTDTNGEEPKAIATDCESPCDFPLAEYPWYDQETSVAINPLDPDNVVVAYRQARRGASAHADNPVIVMADAARVVTVHTHDGGNSWRETVLPQFNDGSLTDLWTVVCQQSRASVAFGPDGTAHIVMSVTLCGGTTRALVVAHSTDGGVSWSGPNFIHIDLEAVHIEEPRFTIDPSTGHMAVAWIDGDYLDPRGIRMSVSMDGGAAWSTPPIRVTMDAGRWPMPVLGANGILHVAYAACEHTCLQVATTKDQGETWETADVATVTREPRWGDLRALLDIWVNLDIDRSGGPLDGRLYLAFPDASTGDSDVKLWWSDDGSTTWSAPIRLNDNPLGDGTDQFHQWMAVDETGRVHASFFDRREDPENLWLRTTYARFDPFTDTIENLAVAEPRPPGHCQTRDHPVHGTVPYPCWTHYDGMDAHGGTVAIAWTQAAPRKPNQEPWSASQDGDMERDVHAAVFRIHDPE